MHEELMSACGLTRNESFVYLALLRIGKARTGEIVREAGISSGKIYETLGKLIVKGLVKTFVENGVKTFVPNNPKMLLSYLKEKENELREKETALKGLIPQLSSVVNKKESPDTVEFVSGIRAVKELAYSSLSSAKTIRIMGVNSSKDVKYNNFWKEWHKERLILGKKAEMLFSDKNTDYWKFFKSLSHTEVRAVLSLSPSAIMIIDNQVFIFSYDEELTCIHIYSKSIADSFHGFFESLWKIASK